MSLQTVATASAIFSDVSQEDWHYSYVNEAYRSGLVSGYDDGTFRPNNSITYAEFAVMICGGFYSAEHNMLKNTVDSQGFWYASYMETLIQAENNLKLSILTDTEAYKLYQKDKDLSHFQEPITRVDVAVVVANVAGSLGKVPTATFDELVLLSYAIRDIATFTDKSASVLKVYYYGYMTGNSDRNFQAHEEITRAELAVVLSNMFDSGHYMGYYTPEYVPEEPEEETEDEESEDDTTEDSTDDTSDDASDDTTTDTEEDTEEDSEEEDSEEETSEEDSDSEEETLG